MKNRTSTIIRAASALLLACVSISNVLAEKKDLPSKANDDAFFLNQPLMKDESVFFSNDVGNRSEHLLKRKKFSDISGNNLNHPNDFLHRVYAEVILGVMGR